MKTAGSIIIVLFVLMACSVDQGMDRYNRLVKSELANNKRVDSIFFGIYFGMPRKMFFAHCWEMNKKGIFRDGLNNMFVLHKLDTGLKHPASMNFYPDFQDSTIAKMRVMFQYDSWAIWNKNLSSENSATVITAEIFSFCFNLNMLTKAVPFAVLEASGMS